MPDTQLASALEVSSLSISFGGIKALEDVSLTVPEGVAVGIIGPNGAGKSTLLNCITGYYSPDEGDITVGGENCNGKSVRTMASLGIARTFQNLELFEDQSVIDNIAFGAVRHITSAFKPSGWRSWRSRSRQITATATDIAVQLGLADVLREEAKTLPYALKKQVELGRALMSRPKILLLDEPTAGLGPDDRRRLVAALAKARVQFEFTPVVIAHDMPLIFEVSEYIYVLDFGRLCACGTPGEVRTNQLVRSVYLGE